MPTTTIKNQKRANGIIEKGAVVKDTNEAAKLWIRSEKILIKRMDGETN